MFSTWLFATFQKHCDIATFNRIKFFMTVGGNLAAQKRHRISELKSLLCVVIEIIQLTHSSSPHCCRPSVAPPTNDKFRRPIPNPADIRFSTPRCLCLSGLNVLLSFYPLRKRRKTMTCAPFLFVGGPPIPPSRAFDLFHYPQQTARETLPPERRPAPTQTKLPASTAPHEKKNGDDTNACSWMGPSFTQR